MEEDDIAAAMGFSSFGGTKKRKYDQANSPKTKVDASGANSTQLGVRVRGTDQTEVCVDATIGADMHHRSQEHPQKDKGKQKPSPATGFAGPLARGQALPEQPDTTDQSDVETASMLPQHDSSTAEMVSFGGTPISRAELNALRSGVRNTNGDTAYFLPSFVEDPWENFMKTNR